MWLLWSENIKKRACRYLLQRYLGNFLLEKLTLDQLSVDLYNGTGTVLDVSLDCEALNELGDSQNWPLEIVDGYMNQITVTIPWSTLLKDDSIVEVNGLSITVQPKVRGEQAPSMLESMFSSMSSSMQLAAECLRQEDVPADAHPVEGIEMFAHAIDSILTRVKVKFVNTKIRIEHVPKNGDKGIALEIHIKHIDYFDEASTEPPPEQTDPEKTKTYIVSTFTNKKITFEGVTLYTDEFPSKLRTIAPSLIMEKSVSSQSDKTLDTSQIEASDINFQSTTSDVFYETRSMISNTDTELFLKDNVLEQHTNPDYRRETTPEERAKQPDPILFAKLNGKQDLTLKIKHTEEAHGPKVDFQLTLGSLVVFLSPRQLHMLVELAEGLNQPHLEDTSNIPLRSTNNLQCKPMRQADFQLIEAQLLANISRQSNKQNIGHGWSGQSFDDSDIEGERFLPMTAGGNPMTDSLSSSVSSMSASMSSSVHVPASQPTMKRNRKVPQVDGDPTAEVSHINIKIASCSCVLLHKDVLVPPPVGTDCISPASARRMHEISVQFFERLGLFYLTGHYTKDMDLANETFDRATSRSHLRLIATTISLDGSEKTTTHGSQTSGEGLISNFLLRECLYYSGHDEAKASESFDLIRFERQVLEEDDDSEACCNSASVQPNVQISFKQTLKYVRISGEKKLIHPTTDISVKCTPFLADIELTLLERMSATVFGNSSTNASTSQSNAPRSQNQLNFSLICPKLDVILRFPIADLRPGINREVRRVRQDYISFKFHDVLLNSQQAPSLRPLPTTVNIRASSIDLYYHENVNDIGTHLARANIDSTVDSNILKGADVALPKISLTFQPKKTARGPFDSSSDEEPNYEPHSPSANPMTQSIYLMDKLKDTSQPSPFSSKKMAHQGVMSHENGTQSQTEELIVPGSEAEMEEFTQSAVERASIHLDLNFPVVSLQLESKQIYEIIYNRINSDLLLWEPQTTDQYEISPHIAYPYTDTAHEGSIYPAFAMCKSGLRYESNSDSSSSEEDNVYYSTYDQKMKNKKITAARPIVEKRGSHDFCMTLKIHKGLLSIYAPVRDSNKRVVPCQLGELVIEASKLSMCQVSGVNGKAKHVLMCLRSTQATLYHAALISVPSEKPPLRLQKSVLPSHLKQTIYPSGKGVMLKDRVITKDMVTLALSVEPHNDLPNFKKVCMALGIEQATLRHRGNSSISWLTQLIDVIDVLDYPVPGYQPSTVLTEMHVHMWDCAIDYRPLYLPIRTVTTLGNFSVSSNVVAQTNSTNLKFLAQECALFLSHIQGTKPGIAVPLDDDKQPDLYKDYICVVDLGLFELSLKMNDKANESGPRMDLCASNNCVNVRTCWDSASALCRLVTYIAVDGDTLSPADPATRHASFCSDRTEEPLLGLDDKLEEIRELSPNEIQQVNDLMEEAMQESPNATLDDEEINTSTEKEGVEIFFFPDEPYSKLRQKQASSDTIVPLEMEGRSLEYEDFTGAPDVAEEAKPTIVQVAKELGDPSSSPKDSPKKAKRKAKVSDGGNTDDEYCIIDTQAAREDDDLAEPTIRWFTSEHVPMIENHFTVPVAKSDVLKAPKSFPMPTLRYTLYEMSITWHMYGGNDFKTVSDVSPSQNKKNVTIIEGEGKGHGSPTAAKRNLEYEPYETGRATAAAYRQGGVAWSAGHERVRAHTAEPVSRGEWRTRGGRDRDRHTLVQMHLNKIKFQHEIYPTGGPQASRQTLAIGKIEIIDRLSISSINKFLSQYVLKDEPERKHANMLVIKAVHLRPDPELTAQECCLKVSLLPLRFIIDQDTLTFLINFFSKLGTDEPTEEDNKSLGGVSSESGGSRQTTPTHRAPVMSVASHLRDPPPTPTSLPDSDTDTMVRDEEPLMENYEAERLVSENLIQLEEDFHKMTGGCGERPRPPPPDQDHLDDSPLYFRRVVFAPEVPIRLDYVGKRVDLSAGPVAGLLMGLGQLNCSELRLKRLYHRHGLLGLERLLRWALQEWLGDIKRYQLPGLLSGIGPMHSLLQFITGIRDLVWLPLEQWRRDGRLVHGLRRGAASFTARTAVAALDITARLIHVIQATAETAFDMLTPGPTLQLQDAYDRRERRRRRRHDPARQPNDIREGVASAYQTVKEGFAETAATMAIAARSERGVGGVLRHLPGAAVAPLALAAAGAADVLGGVRAHLAPDLRRDHADKWRPQPHSSID